MTVALFLIAGLLLGSAAVALLLRNLIHSALLLVASWAGVAAFYLWAGAEFVAFAQILVYVSAISMVVLFAVLLTRQGAEISRPVEADSRWRAFSAITVGACLAAVLGSAILSTKLPVSTAAAPALSVKDIGLELMIHHGAALLIVGMILTVALIGATVLAATDKPSKTEDAA
jgi:NADH:ubiquinone oxidoreductase subunit 6 (subunit J)